MRTILSVLFGLLVGGTATYFWLDHSGLSAKTSAPNRAEGKPEPLYWVAPMDANYRRDKPGKSPMGMDLVPVYPDEAGSDSTISISPEVVNNLGVRTAPVAVSQLDEPIETVGYVQYDEDRLVHIHPRVEGWIEKLHAKAEGNEVKKGQPLYELYSPELVSAQEDLLLALTARGPDLGAAAESRLRALHLSDKHIQRLRKTRQAEQRVTFYAPQDGVLASLMVREGFFVKPGNTMMSIGVVDHVWVEAEVFERQAARVQPGLPVELKLDYYPGKIWRGEVDYVYPMLDEMTRTLRIRLKFKNEDALLKPNMFARVTITPESTEPTLVIPAEALIRTGGEERVVLALGEGRFNSVLVRTGRKTRTQIEILEGLAMGDEIVTSAQFLIDSESRKAAEFHRMGDADRAEVEVTEAPQSATVMGVVNRIDPGNRKLTISRDGIPKWNRGPATMDFSVANAVDITALSEGDRIRFTFTVGADRFEITSLVRMNDGGVQ